MGLQCKNRRHDCTHDEINFRPKVCQLHIYYTKTHSEQVGFYFELRQKHCKLKL